ncbi:MAG TPA: hypothetical protein VKE95_11385 [Burkholderiales bacterium]|nr:hypothetical protein [Burkholderiales bacterium]
MLPFCDIKSCRSKKFRPSPPIFLVKSGKRLTATIIADMRPGESAAIYDRHNYDAEARIWRAHCKGGHAIVAL